MPEAIATPGYWMNETSGVLRPAVEAYLAGGAMTVMQVGAMRAYLRQWIALPVWQGPTVEELRSAIGGLTTRANIEAWLNHAEDAGIDPL